MIAIKDMKMPTECEYCGFCRYYPENGNVWCNANNRILKLYWKEPDWTHLDVKRPDWCPLIEIKTDGGMISRQAAIDAIEQLDLPEDMCVFEILSHIELALGTLTSARPETNCSEIPNNSDLISRQAAIDVINAISNLDEKAKGGIITTFLLLDSAQSECKTGRWIKVNGYTAINCSACYHCSWSLSFEDTVKKFNFCPNCGAKMENDL